MDPNPKSFPILSYVMARLPSVGLKPNPTDSFDIEQPPPPQQQEDQTPPEILNQLPRLTDPVLIAAMTKAISDVSQARSVLQTLGPRPNHESVDRAKQRMAEIDSTLAKQLEELFLLQRPADVDMSDWRAHLSDKQRELTDAAEREKGACKVVLQLEEMHEAYEVLLRDAEDRLVKIYDGASRGGEEVEVNEEGLGGEEDNVVSDEVVGILKEASGNVLERVDLDCRKLRIFPEAFGRIAGLRVLNVSNNLLQVVPDSISGLQKLEELNLASNLLVALPDSIGLLVNLKILNVSTNKLEKLPDTICHCKSLVELDASFNRLTYLPTSIGCEMLNLQRLSVQLNKIRYLPTSIGDMISLRYLDAHFNELHGLPFSVGKLTNLETLNISNNFSDLKELPETFGDLVNLKELDLSNNQIHTLPDTFGRLDNLTKMSLDENPIVTPPVEVVKEGVEAVKLFMAKRWLDILVEEERKSMLEVQEQTKTGWLARSTSLLKSYASSVSESVSGYLSPRTPRDSYLDQQL